MKQTLCLSIAAVFLFGAVAVHGAVVGSLANIDCDSVTAISFNIDIPDINQWDDGDADDVDAWALNGKNVPSCKPSFDQQAGQVQYLAFSVEDCANEPTVSADDTKLEYTFSINVAATAGPGPPIVYAYDHQYTVTCLYNREKDNLMAMFEPLHSLSDEASGNGELVIEFTLHSNEPGEPELSGIIDLSTAIFGKVVVETENFPNLDIHFQSVSASEDAGNLVNPVTLVTDGCEDNNGIVGNTECDANADDKFFLDAFRFQDQVPGEKVYFHATVIVCLASDGSSECQTECLVCNPPPPPAPGRKRRETVKESLQTTYYVKAGPYRVVDSTNKETTAEKQQEATAFPSYAIAIVAVCGVLAIAIASAVVVIVLRRRRQNTTFAEGRDAGVTA